MTDLSPTYKQFLSFSWAEGSKNRVDRGVDRMDQVDRMDGKGPFSKQK